MWNLTSVKFQIALMTVVAFVYTATLGGSSTAVQEPPLLFSGDCSRISSPASSLSAVDVDADGITDTCEQSLAEKFAPIIYHSSDESNFPTNVDWFLNRTELWFYNAEKPEAKRLISHPSQSQLLGSVENDGRVPPQTIKSSGTWSKGKRI